MPAPLVDTHAHLFDDRFAADRPAVLDRARAAGVVAVLAVGIDGPSNTASVAIANAAPDVWAAVGIQPNHVGQSGPGDWDAVVRLAESEPRVVAIGETGLDRYWKDVPFPDQQESFARHLALSRRLAKPLVIHCREAEADVVAMLRDDSDRHGPVRGVMHSFTGDAATADACLAMGLFVSFAGMVTYKTADALRAVAARIPADRILVETDCPYLAPQAVRGRRNEPAFVAHTAAALATVRGETVDALARQSTANAWALFGFGN